MGTDYIFLNFQKSSVNLKIDYGDFQTAAFKL